MALTYFATIRVKPKHMEEACAAVLSIVPATQAEEGCIAFEPRRAVDGSSTIMIFEEWADRAAFDHHHSQEYTRDVFTKYENWLESPPVLFEMKLLES